ncbi:type IV pilus biogenesis/stability protein PilW [Marinicella gelatinilytica]|uniref:type IV pilus biogenesis/stability protein PilW n=1 Tax=Marinicella gelatinilytica TaxID=2996017 RepID=UPI002260CACA|nr:type IV pilus biogenesis/stability protein PilW [Marinicella gelatinilytica]MCX7545965.1 type IV pilus biogenesis/stability protein PilW [Marinicella gelatinilytica]
MKHCFLCLSMMLLVACAQTGPATGYDEPTNRSDPNSPAMLNVRMGVAYFERQDYDLALEKLKRAIAMDPKLAIAHSALALVYSTMGAGNEASKHYKASVKFAPNDPIILNNYGTFLCQQGDYKKALEFYQRTLANPFYKTPETVHENAGVCLMKDDLFDEAERHFRAALSVNPEMTVSLYNMAILSAGQDRPLKARAFIQRLSRLQALDERMLTVAYQVERKLGNENEANKYLTQLRKLK